MRHYEIVVLIHPDQSDQVPAMIKRYKNLVSEAGCKIHREEDWGRRQLTHTISKAHKAHYILMNIECTKDILDELVSAFRFNDAVLRHLIIKRDYPITESSIIAKENLSNEDESLDSETSNSDQADNEKNHISRDESTEDKDKSTEDKDKSTEDKDESTEDKDESTEDKDEPNDEGG